MMVLRPSIARAARAYTGLGHIALAQMAGVATRTVHKLEKDGRVTSSSLEKITEVLRSQGVELVRNDRGIVTGLSFGDKR